VPGFAVGKIIFFLPAGSLSGGEVEGFSGNICGRLNKVRVSI
jgi:hypothetical protein